MKKTIEEQCKSLFMIGNAINILRSNVDHLGYTKESESYLHIEINHVNTLLDDYIENNQSQELQVIIDKIKEVIEG